MRAQSSMEFLLIVGFSLAMLVPATLLFLEYTSGTQNSVVDSQIYQAGTQLSLTAEQIYSVGVGSWQTIELIIPDGVDRLVVYEATDPNNLSEMVLEHGDSSIVFFTDIPLWNSSSMDCTAGCLIPIHQGRNVIRVESKENFVGGQQYPRIRFTVIQ